MKGLKHGDQARIAEITGFSHDLVKKVIRGARNNAQILQVAKQLIADRERLANQVNQQTN